MSLCEYCVTGAKHEGTAEGKWETINGVNTYVATPTGQHPANAALLYLPDVFGPQSPNSQLLADSFAKNGFKAYVPDFLNGDPLTLEQTSAPGWSIQQWFPQWAPKHGPAQTRPVIDVFIAGLKEQGITTLYGTGYCFGGRYVWDLALENIIKVAVVAHPSMIKAPEDFEKYVAVSKAPLLINSCTIDPQFSQAACEAADELLGSGKFAPGYKRVHFEGCTHGFAIRGDLTNPLIKAGKEGAFKESVEWLKAHV